MKPLVVALLTLLLSACSFDAHLDRSVTFTLDPAALELHPDFIEQWDANAAVWQRRDTSLLACNTIGTRTNKPTAARSGYRPNDWWTTGPVPSGTNWDTALG
jgi:hypothetical protein